MIFLDRDDIRETFRLEVLAALDRVTERLCDAGGFDLPKGGTGATDADLPHLFPAIDAQMERVVQRLGCGLTDANGYTLEALANHLAKGRATMRTETITPDQLRVGDKVTGNGALWRVLARDVPAGVRANPRPGAPLMVEVECIDPQGVSAFTVGFRKQFCQTPRGGTWDRIVEED